MNLEGFLYPPHLYQKRRVLYKVKLNAPHTAQLGLVETARAAPNFSTSFKEWMQLTLDAAN
jgi:hypothetical protein